MLVYLQTPLKCNDFVKAGNTPAFRLKDTLLNVPPLRPFFIECVHAWLCVRTFTYARVCVCGVTFQQLACPGPFSECEESLQLCEGVCACFSTFSNFFFFALPSFYYLNTAKSVFVNSVPFFSCNVGQTFESWFAFFAHRLHTNWLSSMTIYKAWTWKLWF